MTAQVKWFGPSKRRLTIVGKDLDIGNTFNSDCDPAAGLQMAGRFMSYDAANMKLVPWDGVADAPGVTIFGVLSDDISTLDDTGAATLQFPVMVYRTGTFLRQELEIANNAVITPDGPLDNALRDKGIYLEWSYQDYEKLPTPPAGAPPAVMG
jgi:hypothetical protein